MRIIIVCNELENLKKSFVWVYLLKYTIRAHCLYIEVIFLFYIILLTSCREIKFLKNQKKKFISVFKFVGEVEVP